MKINVHPKEKTCLALMGIISAFFYGSLLLGILSSPVLLITLVPFILFFVVMNFIGHLFFIGHLRGNGIKVNKLQLPEIFEIVERQASQLGLARTPDVYVLQGNGILNAFATRFAGKNCVILLSTILEAAYHDGKPAVEFIIGHELGHIARKHVDTLKNLLLLPARLCAPLALAYSRACEYTCDRIGQQLAPQGALDGLLILAAGAHVYKKINTREVLASAAQCHGLAVWLSEYFSTHPHLVKRVAALEETRASAQAAYAWQPARSDVPQAGDAVWAKQQDPRA